MLKMPLIQFLKKVFTLYIWTCFSESKGRHGRLKGVSECRYPRWTVTYGCVARPVDEDVRKKTEETSLSQGCLSFFSFFSVFILLLTFSLVWRCLIWIYSPIRACLLLASLWLISRYLRLHYRLALAVIGQVHKPSSAIFHLPVTSCRLRA